MENNIVAVLSLEDGEVHSPGRKQPKAFDTLFWLAKGAASPTEAHLKLEHTEKIEVTGGSRNEIDARLLSAISAAWLAPALRSVCESPIPH